MPFKIAQGSPPHWALRIAGALVVAYLALRPLFMDFTPSEHRDLAELRGERARKSAGHRGDD